MEVLYLVNTADKREYKVIAYDQEEGMITLEGKHGQFTEKFDKELFKRMGYAMTKKVVEEEDA